MTIIVLDEHRSFRTADRRTREEIITRKGKAATDAVNVAREEIANALRGLVPP